MHREIASEASCIVAMSYAETARADGVISQYLAGTYLTIAVVLGGCSTIGPVQIVSPADEPGAQASPIPVHVGVINATQTGAKPGESLSVDQTEAFVRALRQTRFFDLVIHPATPEEVGLVIEFAFANTGFEQQYGSGVSRYDPSGISTLYTAWRETLTYGASATLTRRGWTVGRYTATSRVERTFKAGMDYAKKLWNDKWHQEYADAGAADAVNQLIGAMILDRAEIVRNLTSERKSISQ